jgi:hypothetical protein
MIGASYQLEETTIEPTHTEELKQIAYDMLIDWKIGKATYLQYMEARENYLRSAGLLRYREGDERNIEPTP